ncbi:GldG family protein [Futiania mangrovi]|uniref:GldG family protein n=1 Tax=Futiania mangrovi TaxID=2959716 RepID=A0A9J6PFP7_9PROT|nr:GldG family protein [Futiania mangrovii]MCP1336627.1 GldG family protein [Futiania mangrovii]
MTRRGPAVASLGGSAWRSGFAAVFLREAAAIFGAPLAVLFAVVFVFFAAALSFHATGLLDRGEATLDPFFATHPYLHMVLMPALAMRAWAEERRSGSAELLLTLPLPLWAAVGAKFLATWVFAATMLAATTPVWATVAWLGNPDHGVVLAGYLASLLMAGAYLAIGHLASALTASQVVAFVAAVAAGALLTAAGLPLVLEPAAAVLPGRALAALADLSILGHFTAILRGVLEARDAVYFLTVIGGGLAATAIVVAGWRTGGAPFARVRTAAALILVAVTVIALNVAASGFLRHARIDLTAEGAWTLGAPARTILSRLQEPVSLRFYRTPETLREAPELAGFARRVEDLLREIAHAADGKVVLDILDPAPFSEMEDRAVADGMRAVGAGDGRRVYFGLAGANTVDGRAAIPFFLTERAKLLEYDLLQMIDGLDRVVKPRVGVLSSLPLATGPGGPGAALRGEAQPFPIWSELASYFDLEILNSELEIVPPSIGVLLILHPPVLSEGPGGAVARFLADGGKAVILLDPFSELVAAPDALGRRLPGVAAASHLPDVLASWGVAMDRSRVVADPGRAARVAGLGPGGEGGFYPVWLTLGTEDMASSDPVASQLARIVLASAGAIDVSGLVPGLIPEPVLVSSPAAVTIPISALREPQAALAAVRAADNRGQRMLAVRLSGRFPLPDGEAAGSDPRPGSVLLIGDIDLADARLWRQPSARFGARASVPSSDNAAFLVNAVDHMLGSTDLLALRGRTVTDRRFTRIEEMRRAAAREMQAEESALAQRLKDAEARLAETEADGPLALAGSRRQTEIEALRADVAASRAALRAVRHRYDAAIATLKLRLMLLNMVAAPLLAALVLLAGAAIGRALARAWRAGRIAG